MGHSLATLRIEWRWLVVFSKRDHGRYFGSGDPVLRKNLESFQIVVVEKRSDLELALLPLYSPFLGATFQIPAYSSWSSSNCVIFSTASKKSITLNSLFDPLTVLAFCTDRVSCTISAKLSSRFLLCWESAWYIALSTVLCTSLNC